MPYRSYHSRRRFPMRRRRSGGVAGKFARGMQNRALTYVKKRYTKVFTMDVIGGAAPGGGERSWERTISHVHNRNSNATDPNATITLFDVDQDSQLSTDMDLYQYAKITGVAFKLLFPEGTTPESTP